VQLSEIFEIPVIADFITVCTGFSITGFIRNISPQAGTQFFKKLIADLPPSIPPLMISSSKCSRWVFFRWDCFFWWRGFGGVGLFCVGFDGVLRV